MKRSTDGILTTHTGSLPRPPDLQKMLLAKDNGVPVEPRSFAETARKAVAEVVQRQAQIGITVPSDGEQSKISYATYIRERLSGFGTDEVTPFQSAEARDFPEYAAQRQVVTLRRPTCVGPIEWKDFAQVEADVENLRAACRGVETADVFMTAASPGVAALFLQNRYYSSSDEYLQALADALKREYKAVADAGFILQLDCPDLAMGYNSQFLDLSLEEFRKVVARHIELVDYATAEIPAEQLRLHMCWGNGAGPHHHDVPLAGIIDLVLKARPRAFSFVAANPRHEHEWRVWQDVKLPDEKVIIPGVIDSTTNIIEHPDLVAERIVRFAGVVGRENVIAGSDCGFGTSASWAVVHPEIAWAKLRSLAEGAQIATRQLWGR
jgi:5-methyltetrahydropteroyltriglutamate--homocysteine methyltransferase